MNFRRNKLRICYLDEKENEKKRENYYFDCPREAELRMDLTKPGQSLSVNGLRTNISG